MKAIAYGQDTTSNSIRVWLTLISGNRRVSRQHLASMPRRKMFMYISSASLSSFLFPSLLFLCRSSRQPRCLTSTSQAARSLIPGPLKSTSQASSKFPSAHEDMETTSLSPVPLSMKRMSIGSTAVERVWGRSSEGVDSKSCQTSSPAEQG